MTKRTSTKKSTKKKSTKKKAAKKKARTSGSAGTRAKPANDSTPPVRLAIGEARVRMYRIGLGDCFLLTFGGPDRNFHVLIDCGTLGAKETEQSDKVSVQAVVDDIYNTAKHRIDGTDKHHIDLVIATHEHWDHLSGFTQLRKLFKKDAPLTIGEVWLAWTENPADPRARELAKNRADIGEALAFARDKLSLGSDAHDKISGIMDFLGEGPLLGAGGRFAPSTNAAMHTVRTEFSPRTRYLEQGEGPIDHDLLRGFRVYVLGPPRDKKWLATLEAPAVAELTGIRAGLSLDDAGAPVRPPARDDAPGPDHSHEAQHSPFDLRHRCHDPHDAARWYDGYHAPSEQWRRIDDAWLSGLPHLALQLDAMTNNTSLVLAFERISDGKVMLFPADAQEGNWLSWHTSTMKWRVKNESTGRMKTVTADDLLARTVFYKVGHHGSHNATAKTKGLDRMAQDGQFVAFIPVDRKVALSRNPQGSWRMPAKKLYLQLIEKCSGLVLRSDIGWARKQVPGNEIEEEFVELALPGRWKAWAATQSQAETDGMIAISDIAIDFTLRIDAN